MGRVARRGVWLEIVWGPTGPFGVQTALRASRHASPLGKGTACVLALLVATGHAAERSREPVASGVLYVSATVVAFGNVECGWEDPPAGATVGCVPPVAEGAGQRIMIRQVDAQGEPVAAETDLEF